MSASSSTHRASSVLSISQDVSAHADVDRRSDNAPGSAPHGGIRHAKVNDVQVTGVCPEQSGEQSPASVRLYTLGTFQLLLDLGSSESRRTLDLTRTHLWGHGRAQDLLLLLLLHRRPLRRQEAAATLWPDADPIRRARLLRNALWNLRSALAQHATTTSEVNPQSDRAQITALILQDTPFALSLHLVDASSLDEFPRDLSASPSLPADPSGRYWCDVLAFEAAASRVREADSVEERTALGREALRLYGGPFMAHRQGGSGALAAPAWMLDQRGRVQAQWIHLSLEVATGLRRGGAWEQALDLLLRVLEEDPLQLEATRRAMLLLSDLNRVDEALVVYERCRRSHYEAFHKDPGDLKRMATQLRTGHAVRRAPGWGAGRAASLATPSAVPYVSGAHPLLPRASQAHSSVDSATLRRSPPAVQLMDATARRSQR